MQHEAQDGETAKVVMGADYQGNAKKPRQRLKPPAWRPLITSALSHARYGSCNAWGLTLENNKGTG